MGAFFSVIVLARFAGCRVQGKHWDPEIRKGLGVRLFLGAGYWFDVGGAASAAVSVLSTA